MARLVTGFYLRKALHGVDSPATLAVRIGDSKTITIGDAVRVNTSGLLDIVGGGNPVLGIVVGIEDENEINPFSLGFTNSTGATLTPDHTVATASDNSTRANYLKARVVVDQDALFYNDADANLAQTNLFQCCDVLAASDQIDGSEVSDTSGQFQLVQIDPDGDADLSKGLWRIAESQLLRHVGNSTAIIAA